ncbi:MAG: DNA mismatch repair endonuclease MutL [Marinilabiliales bacterium]|nr:DNA mismatch repair endonuclease MutL [Marinilabiliales bacterium]
MSDIIRLLPDSVANQIAAGEVIQRPASVVKELVENAMDAGAEQITVHVKDAGRTLIQVIDNGKGMSPTDARMAFERHATSKIREANDLFAIRTMGFRGEALASIASVADVELKTRQRGEELGTYLHILGSVVQKQQLDPCPEGSNFSVKNLFFNVPARRKFLKSNSSELKNIISELQRVALANPAIAISLLQNQSPVFELPPENVHKRIVSLFGKGINNSLTPVETETTLVKISGFIGQPKYAKKSFGEQFFFVNGRFMKHPFFHKAVMNGYDKLLLPDCIPSYFLYFEVDPASIDINIHPTKTEIKFEDEMAIWQILQAAIREAIGKYNLMPAIDFDQRGSIDIPIMPGRGSHFEMPGIEVDRFYNPFHTESQGWKPGYQRESVPNQWEQLYGGLEKKEFAPGLFPPVVERESIAFRSREESMLSGESASDPQSLATGATFLQLKNRYLLTPVKSGLMIIDQREAHARILYEKFVQMFGSHLSASQRLLFPPVLELSPADAEILQALRQELQQLGFEIRAEAGNLFYIDGTPAVLSHLDAKELLDQVIASFQEQPVDLMEEVRGQLALILAQSSAVHYGVALKQEEMNHLFNQLFACQSPAYSPSGKRILTILPMAEIENMLRG